MLKLENFSIDLELRLFAAAAAVALLIARATIRGNSYRASGAQPSWAPRYG